MNRDIIIIGSGGHAKVVIDIIRAQNKFKIVGCLSNDCSQTSICSIPILGNDSLLESIFDSGIKRAFIAIGDNKLRVKLSRNVRLKGFSLVSAFHPSSVISKNTTIGSGTAVMAGAIINPGVEIHSDVILNTGCTIDHDCTIKVGSHIAPGSHLAGNVTVGEGAFLGVGTVAIPNICIGDWAIIGAGSTVTKNIPAKTVSYGTPCKVITSQTD